MKLEWMLPLVGHRPSNSCSVAELGSGCLSGFAIQGNMDSRRRNYTLIWNQIDERLNASQTLRQDSRFKINVVGSGQRPGSAVRNIVLAVLNHLWLPRPGSGSPSKLEVPERLSERVLPHVNLRFDDFYDLIHHNLALLPTLASEAYYDRKFSSTVSR